MDRDNKISGPKDSLVGKDNHTEFDFIKDKPHLVYIIKKLERLSSAIHLVTNSLPQSEPIRMSLREECLLVLKNVLFREQNKGVLVSLEAGILHSISLLDIARRSLLISDMNAGVLRREFLDLLPVINNLYASEMDYTSFDVSALNISGPAAEGGEKRDLDTTYYKRHSKSASVLYSRNKRTLPSTDRNNSDDVKKIDNSGSTREIMILDIIKNKKEVGIKDITSLIRGVSSKTIQRHLTRLVLSNVLKKSGSRRWSRYSIVE